MTSHSIYVPMTIELIYCSSCDAPIALPDRRLQEFRTNGKSFLCPNGHSQYFPHSEMEKLKAELRKIQNEKAALVKENKALQKAKDAAVKAASLVNEEHQKKNTEEAHADWNAGRQAKLRTDYEWKQEEKERLIALRREHPIWVWRLIGDAMGRTGAQCASMYHALKKKGKITEGQDGNPCDEAWTDIEQLLVNGAAREVIAEKYGVGVEILNSFIDGRLKTARKSA